MFLTILNKEFLNHLLGFRFVLSTSLCLLLMIMSITILTGNYMARRGESQRNVTAYRSEAEQQGSYFNLSREGVKVERLPAKLQIPAYGLEKIPDRTAKISAAGAPRTLRQLYINPLMSLFPVADVLFVVATVLSLLAFVVSYDAVTGELEQGTMKLLMSYSVPRDRLVLAKWLGGYFSLAIPFLLSAGIGSIIILLANVDYDAADWLAFGLLLVLSLLFLAAMFSIGMFVSCVCRQSSTSITVLLLIWVVFVLIVPNASPYAGARMVPMVPFSTVESEIAQESGDAMERFHGKLRGRRREMKRAFRGGGPEAEQARQELATLFTNARNELMAEIDRIEQSKMDKFTRAQNRQVAATKNVSRLSPIAAYVYAATDIASTGTRKREHFFLSLQEYQRQFKQYIERKTSGALLKRGFRRFFGGGQDFDLSDMPVFEYEEETLSRRFLASVWDIVVLAGYAILFILASYLSFMRADLI